MKKILGSCEGGTLTELGGESTSPSLPLYLASITALAIYHGESQML